MNDNPARKLKLSSPRPDRIAAFAWLAALVLVALSLCLPPDARAGDADSLRAERVGWARLKTPSLSWMRHSSGDPVLMRFLKDQTSLNIAPTWYVADVEKLNEMCRYPLLFSQGVHMVSSENGRSNTAEYLRRGGFLLIDACIATSITPDPDLFLQQESQWLRSILPDVTIVPLPNNHLLYRCFYDMPAGPPHTYFDNIYDSKWARHGFYAIRLGQRMAGIISLSGLQCGWDKMVAPPGHDVACMKMLVNVYIYAMMQTGGD
ncbi:MAG: DUF4159 domain-containing protein [Verrucomicrobiota bacterium]